ncbi:ATP-dependent RNA helicase [Corynebacterium sp.]|uniref:ATP-dependent RNA helicase n=1 Tax=Corynebacterium sp. TaxID=1720 RepID=UPI0026DA9E11|nr:ATP-dependent helicase C-terminal domain-containing protein [Corynebacterium sp.]MDO5032594.1 ATP-dependent helicase C-terminal domain-containing protein [Corynebacterium sp.]
MPQFNLEEIGAGLPVAQTIDSLPASGHVVVQAPPGTGKTTLVPPALANQSSGKVLVTAPRRVAVRAAANRLQKLSGQRIGYAVRGDSRKGEKVEFLTPGVLLRRLIRDPELSGVSAVAIDEVHERQLDTDLVLAMCLELAQLRDDFRVIAMSATVDAQRFSQLMGGAPIHVTEAATYPLDVRYQPIPGRAAGTREFWRGVAQLAAEQRESTLVFVPGVREVNLVCEQIPGAFPLHGRQSTQEQDAALYTEATRVVVATSIAESSVTVPGVRTVIDAGLSRIPKRDARRGMTGLVTVSTSKSSADQRAGRAGREAPGTVIRCYSEQEYEHFTPHAAPEILSADLTQAALFMQCWGAGEDFPLLDPPPAAALARAQRTLSSLHATEEMALMPTDPRFAAALLTHGAQAAKVIAQIDDSDAGRLARLVPDKGPVDPGVVIATAFPESVAKRVGEEYLLASGTRASSSEHAPWLAVTEVSLSNSGRALVRQAEPIAEEDALEIIGVRESTRAFLDGTRVRGVRVKSAGAIVLSETPLKVSGEEAVAALAEAVSQEGLDFFRFSEKAQSLRDRLRHLRACYGDPWPDLEKVDPPLLRPELEELAHGRAPDMFPALQRLLPWPEATRLEELAPERLAVPSGRQARIDWSGERPVVSIKLQECFGLAESPTFCGQRVQFHLLSPAGRPLAVTDDLASFWSGPYQGVRAEMRGRYPKHPWPEDPWNAQATARTKKNSR